MIKDKELLLKQDILLLLTQGMLNTRVLQFNLKPLQLEWDEEMFQICINFLEE